MTPRDRQILEGLIRRAERESGFGPADISDCDNLELDEYYHTLTDLKVSYPAA